MVANFSITVINNTISRTWAVMNTEDSEYSIAFFGNRLKTYITSGMFGLTTGFGLNIVCFVIILFTTGILSYKFGLNNPLIIAVIATSLVAVLELGLGLIDVGGKVPLTAWALIVVVGLVIKEGFT
jgi:hypothetical protein